MRTNRNIIRAAGVITAISAAMVAGAIAASAHVETDPGQATKGDDSTVTFRVPNEEVNAGVVKLEVTFPADHPIAEVNTTPIPGWTVKVDKDKLPKPVHQNNSDVTEAVTKVTWTAQPGTQIAPGEFLRFTVLAGPMPDTTDQLLLPATQTYSNGDVVQWNQPPAADGAPKPEHPAPALKLVAGEETPKTGAAAETPASGSSDTLARGLGIGGLVVGALGLIFAVATALRFRRTNS